MVSRPLATPYSCQRPWAYFALSFLCLGWIAFPRSPNPDSFAADLTRVGSIQTNGEEWVVFKFDAPKSRAVLIQGIWSIGKDRMIFPSLTRAEAFPAATSPVWQQTRAGGSNLLKVRRVGGGAWQARVYFVAPLRLASQWRGRLQACWRFQSFKPLMWDLIEPDRYFVESGFVTTVETVPQEIKARPRTQPSSEFVPDLFSLEMGTTTTDESHRSRE